MPADPVANILLRLSPLARVIIVLSGAVLIHLSLGTYHTFGNMLPYMASYMRNHTDSSINLEHLVWIPSFQGCFPFAMIIGGYLSNRIGPRASAFIGCSLMASGVFLTYYTIQYSFYLFLLTYGVMFGLGQGMAYVVTVSCVINWAPEHVGLVSGVVAAGFGVSSSIFAPIQTMLINPWNFKPTINGYFLENELVERVPSVFLKLSCIYAVMQLIGLSAICDPPDQLAQKYALREQLSESRDIWSDSTRSWRKISRAQSRFGHYGYKKLPVISEEDQHVMMCDNNNTIVLTGKSLHESYEESENEQLLNDDETERSMSTPEMLKSSTFYALFVALFCCSFYGNMFYNLYKTFGETFIDDDIFMAFAFSIASVLNAAARISWGLLTDMTSFQTSLSCATLLATFLLLTMPLTPVYGKWVYFLWMNLMFVCLAATHALFITASVRCFGPRHKSTNYGYLILSTTISAVFLAVGCQYLLLKVGYSYAFLITAAFPFIAFLITSSIGWTPQGNRIT